MRKLGLICTLTIVLCAPTLTGCSAGAKVVLEEIIIKEAGEAAARGTGKAAAREASEAAEAAGKATARGTEDGTGVVKPSHPVSEDPSEAKLALTYISPNVQAKIDIRKAAMDAVRAELYLKQRQCSRQMTH